MPSMPSSERVGIKCPCGGTIYIDLGQDEGVCVECSETRRLDWGYDQFDGLTVEVVENG